MPDIEIISGFAEGVVDNGSEVTFSLGTPPIVLAIGTYPVRNFMGPGSLIPALITPQEWLAVAVQRNYFYGSSYVLLAFRRFGLRGDAQAANFTIAAWILAFSVLGMVASFRNDTLTHAVNQ